MEILFSYWSDVITYKSISKVSKTYDPMIKFTPNLSTLQIECIIETWERDLPGSADLPHIIWERK